MSLVYMCTHQKGLKQITMPVLHTLSQKACMRSKHLNKGNTESMKIQFYSFNAYVVIMITIDSTEFNLYNRLLIKTQARVLRLPSLRVTCFSSLCKFVHSSVLGVNLISCIIAIGWDSQTTPYKHLGFQTPPRFTFLALAQRKPISTLVRP